MSTTAILQGRPRSVPWPSVALVVFVACLLAVGWLKPWPLFAHLDMRWLGLIVCAAAAGLTAWSLVTRRGASTVADSAPLGPTWAITGPYRWSRNPMVVADTLLLVGIALVANSAWALWIVIPLALVRHYGTVRREEQALTAMFGDTYCTYCSRTRRYL